MVFDITINFSELFKGCFSFKRKNNENLNVFIQSLRNHSKESRIQSILQKAINGKNNLGLLYEVNDNNYKLINFYGNHNDTQINSGVVIPIYKNMTVKYLLVILKNKKKNKIKIDEELINILRNTL